MKQMIEDLRSIVALKMLSVAFDVAPEREKVSLAMLIRAHVLRELPHALDDLKRRGF